METQEKMTVRDMRSSVADEAPASAQPVVALTQETVLLQVISRAAADRTIDLDRMERLLAMQKELAAKRAEQDFIASITQFKQSAPRIMKGKLVSFPHRNDESETSYKHATLGAVCDGVIAGLAAVGISHAWELEQKEGGRVRVTCVLTHVGGHSTRTSLEGSPDDSGKKNNIQKVSSTITYLERYTLLASTGMATHDQDDDGRGASQEPQETISEEQEMNLEALITEVSADKMKFLRYLKIEKLSDIYAKNYSEVVKLLEAKRRAAT